MTTPSNTLGVKMDKNEQTEYYCEKCNYKCCIKYNWERHLSTPKHSRATEGKILGILKTGKWENPNKSPYCCENCGKEYKDRTGLWRHNKKCKLHENNDAKNENSIDKDELVIQLLKENIELKKLMKKLLTAAVKK